MSFPTETIFSKENSFVSHLPKYDFRGGFLLTAGFNVQNKATLLESSTTPNLQN